MPIKELPDHKLLEQCQAGDQQAYNVLFSRYFKSIFSYALKYIRDHALAEELAMDVMFRLWQRKEHLVTDTNVPAYLFTSIKNAMADHWRKKELRTVSLDDEVTNQQSRSADYKLISSEAEILYRQTLNTLSPRCREVFIKSREQGMTYPQIAREMSLSVNTVKGHMTAALKELRIKLLQFPAEKDK